MPYFWMAAMVSPPPARVNALVVAMAWAIFFVPSPKEKERWKEKVRPISEEWVKKMEGKGSKVARKLFETVTTLGKEYSEKTPGGYVE